MHADKNQADEQQVQCDPDRLRSYLEQLLTPADESAVEAHLDVCPGCQQRMAGAAVDAPWWADASRYLRRDELDELADESAASSIQPPAGEGRLSEQIVMRQIRSWLDASDDPRYIGRFGGYEILGVIGHGGMGVVLRGFEPSLNRFVAIKVLAPELASSGSARARFAREAKAAAAVLHENIIAIHRVDEHHGLPYLAMPYVSGMSLQRRIDSDGPLPLSAVLRIGRQAAAGLAAAHAQGLVHRDIKPANILLERGVDRVTITDFGLARASDDASVTKTGVIAGTPQYMSPEQSRGEPIDARSDLFSLGSVLYTMSVGHPPFRAETNYGVLRRIGDDQPRPVRESNPEMPEWFERIIGRLHAKRPRDRFQSAGELAELLERCLAHVQQPTVVPLPPSLRRARSPRTARQRRPAAWLGAAVLAAAAVVLSVLLAGGGGLWKGQPENSPQAAGEDASSADAGAAGSGHAAAAADSQFAAWNDGADQRIRQLDADAAQLQRQAERFWDDGLSSRTSIDDTPSNNPPHVETQP